MKRLFVILLVVMCMLGCTGRSNSYKKTHNPRRNKAEKEYRQKNTRTTKRKKNNKTIHDTVYMIVPGSADNNALPNDEGNIIIPSTKRLQPVKRRDNLPTAPVIVFSRPMFIYTREECIENNNFQDNMKALVVACDYDNATVRNNAAALVSMSPGSFNLGQICDIFDFCYQNWSYVNDPISHEYFAKASETLKNGLNGDCDDFATLICSMILSIGGEARINFAYTSGNGHAFTEVNIGTTDRNDVMNYMNDRYGRSDLWHKEENGNWWLNLDWQGQYPGAQYWNYERGQCFNILRNEYSLF